MTLSGRCVLIKWEMLLYEDDNVDHQTKSQISFWQRQSERLSRKITSREKIVERLGQRNMSHPQEGST